VFQPPQFFYIVGKFLFYRRGAQKKLNLGYYLSDRVFFGMGKAKENLES
jgi:hypothetical protein